MAERPDWKLEISKRLAHLKLETVREAAITEELAQHLEDRYRDLISGGATEDEALRWVLEELSDERLLARGLQRLAKEPPQRSTVFGSDGSHTFLASLWQDLRYGLRQLRRNPGFTAVAVLTLALGIGATTAIFSVVNAVLLRSLPFRNPSRLIALHEGIPKIGFPRMGFSPPDLIVFERSQKSFSAVGAFRNERVDISSQSEPERVMAARVSASLFPMLGVQPLLGRVFTAQEDRPGSDVAILSYGLWQHRYRGAPSALGQTIQLNRQPYTIVGVMPRNFEFPLRGPLLLDNGSPAVLWVPMAFTPAELQDWGGVYLYSVVGRLRPGVTLAQARSEAESLSKVLVASYPAAIAVWARRGQLSIAALPFHEDVVGSVRALLLVLMAAVAFLLLIACANIATLLVSRATARQKEIAVRSALGATKLRLLRQMLTESLVLAFAGGGAGLVLALYVRNLILAFVPASVRLPRHVPLNGTALAFALATSCFAALLFGLAPAFLVSSGKVQASLQEGGRSGTADGSHRVQGFLVAVEFALALILLVGAGLLIRSFGKLLETQPGFRPGHVLTLNVPLPREMYPHAAQITGFYKQLLRRVSNLPGVESAGLSSDLPLHASEGVSIVIEGRSAVEGQTRRAIVQSWVQGNYFQTMGIPLMEGRWFTPADRLNSPPVAVVSLSMARQFWPGQNAMGKRIRFGVYAPWETIVGIVGNVSQGPLSQPLEPHVYRPYRQLSGPFLEADPFGDWHAMNVAVRTHADPASLTSAVLAQVHSLDPGLAVANIRTMTQVIRSSLAGPRFNAILLGIFASLALFLAAIGVYGVLAYAVARRTHEIGIRMALGARKGDVLKLVLGDGLRLAIIGVAIGLAGALGLTRFLSSLLYGVKPTDPLTLAALSLLLIAVALLASYIPARRAAKVDPMVALRCE
jgi:putative ABC transport system permease protein